MVARAPAVVVAVVEAAAGMLRWVRPLSEPRQMAMRLKTTKVRGA